MQLSAISVARLALVAVLSGGPGLATAQAPCVPTSQYNLVRNGDFESMYSLTPGQAAPSDTGNINFQSPTSGQPTGLRRTEVRCWLTANEESPDGFQPGGLAGFSVPANIRNCNNPNYTGQHTPDGDSYAGIYSTPATVGVGVSRREYITQELEQPLAASTLAAPREYYVEFWTLRASGSSRKMARLGLKLSPTDLYDSIGEFGNLANGSLLGQGTAQGYYTADIDQHDTNFDSTTMWSRTAGWFSSANGQERFVTIGGFEPDAQAGFTQVTSCAALDTATSGGGGVGRGIDDQLAFVGAYYYLDDVLIQAIPIAGPAISYCTPGVFVLGEGSALPASGTPTYHWTGPNGLSVTSTTDPSLTIGPGTPYPLPTTTATYTLAVTVTYPTGPPRTVTTTTTVGPYFTISNGIVISTPTVWSTNMRIHGEVRIAPGGKLTITNEARIEFDDSRQELDSPPHRTRILVEAGTGTSPLRTAPPDVPGGILIVEEGATLTSLQGATPCGTAYMWDGVVVLGNPSREQADATLTVPTGWQGEADFFNCSIENARGVRAGKTTYSTGNLVGGVSALGGGIVRGVNAIFLNCHVGVAFAPYASPSQLANRSGFRGCWFLATAPLADPIYVTSTRVRYGMQAGAVLTGVRGVTFYGNTFRCELPFDRGDYRLRGTGIWGSNATAIVECTVLDPTTGACVGTPNRFENLTRGIYMENHNTGGELVARGNEFTGGYGGICVAAGHGAVVRNNTFEVGLPGVDFCYGLYYAGSYASTPEDNVFRATPVAGIGFTRGLNVVNASQSDSSDTAPLVIYRNAFGEDLSVGIYARNNNDNVTFRCNQFDATIQQADVLVNSKNSTLAAVQGICDLANFPPDPYLTANNQFSNTCGSTLDLQATFSALGFEYPHPDNLPSNRLQPGGTSSCNSPEFTPINCGYPIYVDPVTGRPAGCEGTPQRRGKGALVSALAAETNAKRRQQLVSELMTYYLTDTLVRYGLDSAVALLQGQNDPTFGQKLLQLEERQLEGDYLASTYADDYADDSLGARGTRRPGPGRPRKSRVAALAAPVALRQSAGTDTADYFRRVLLLLRPLRTDSARVAALASGTALRAQFEAMAHDSVVWGCQAARAALNEYAGTGYHELGETDEAGAEAGGSQRAVAPAVAAAAAFVVLTPNPSSGQVRVGYSLGQRARAARAVELRVYDQWGQPAGVHALTDEALASGLSLQLRAGIYHCCLVADGGVVAKDRLLITK